MKFGKLCDKNGILHNFRSSSSSQKGIVESKIQRLQEICHIMLNEQLVSQKFWCHAIETASFILNRASINKQVIKHHMKLLKAKSLL